MTGTGNPDGFADDTVDVVVIGAGIIGLATARALLDRRDDLSIVVVDKEGTIAGHQTGHNSGVIHSGIYYRPGSAKAELAVEGRVRMIDFCLDRDIAHEMCGKVILATDPGDGARLDELERRGNANGVRLERLSSDALLEREPHVRPGAALLVHDAGIVDYVAVCQAMAADLIEAGVSISTEFTVSAIATVREFVEVAADDGRAVRARWLVNCAGLHSDHMVALTGVSPPAAIMPFRGEYHHLRAERRDLCRHLLYPVPDPDFPFLGAHFTRDIHGGVHVGPNAVPAFAREGYRWRDIDLTEVRQLLGRRATWRLARRYWRTGAGEIYRSLHLPALVKALRELVPETTLDDLEPAPAGVRAQAIAPTGDLLDDFVFHDTPRAVHVVNAPSPAATASLAIGDRVAARLFERFDADGR